MEVALDLLGLLAFIAAVLALSAGITYAVVRVDRIFRDRRAAAKAQG